MTDSILDSVKKNLGLYDTDTTFDPDVIMAINTVFSDLHQLGVGPERPFEIEDKSRLWAEFIGDAENINSVKSYVSLRVRLLFDPPATSFAITAMEKQIDKFEWRLNVAVEEAKLNAAING